MLDLRPLRLFVAEYMLLVQPSHRNQGGPVLNPVLRFGITCGILGLFVGFVVGRLVGLYQEYRFWNHK